MSEGDRGIRALGRSRDIEMATPQTDRREKAEEEKEPLIEEPHRKDVPVVTEKLDHVSLTRLQEDRDKNLAIHGPLSAMEPLRSDPIKLLHNRHRRLDRLTALKVPELHYVGQVCSGYGLTESMSEGACCRYV